MAGDAGLPTISPNSATMFNAISGLIPLTAGAVRLDGH